MSRWMPSHPSVSQNGWAGVPLYSNPLAVPLYSTPGVGIAPAPDNRTPEQIAADEQMRHQTTKMYYGTALSTAAGAAIGRLLSYSPIGALIGGAIGLAAPWVRSKIMGVDGVTP